MKECRYCRGVIIQTGGRPRVICASGECRRRYSVDYARKRRESDDARLAELAQQAEYRARPDVKAAKKARMAAYGQRPEVKARKKAYAARCRKPKESNVAATAQFLPGVVAEVGKIKIGTLGPPKATANGSYNPMVRLDEFLITTLDRDRNGVLIPDQPLMDSLASYRDKGPPGGGKLRTIPVMFLSNTIADNLSARYEWWVGRSKIGAATSDLIDGDGPADPEGVTVTWYADPATGAAMKEPRTERMTHEILKRTVGAGDKAKPLFSLATTLSVMIASNAASFGGVYKFRTKGWHSSNQLLGSLRHIKSITCGILRGPVFNLTVAPKQVFGGGVASVAQVVRVDIRGNDLKQLRDDAMAGVRYELENLRTVRAAEQQLRALGRHDDEDEDETLALPAAPPQPGSPAYDLEREDLTEALVQAGVKIDTLRGQSLAQLREAFAMLPK